MFPMAASMNTYSTLVKGILYFSLEFVRNDSFRQVGFTDLDWIGTWTKKIQLQVMFSMHAHVLSCGVANKNHYGFVLYISIL